MNKLIELDAYLDEILLGKGVADAIAAAKAGELVDPNQPKRVRGRWRKKHSRMDRMTYDQMADRKYRWRRFKNHPNQKGLPGKMGKDFKRIVDRAIRR